MARRGLVLTVFLTIFSLFISIGQTSVPEVGRYRFVPVGNSVGYKYDTATGELWKVYIGAENLIWEGIEGADIVGRFELIPRNFCVCELGGRESTPTWYLVDTATGSIWHITAVGAVPLGSPM